MMLHHDEADSVAAAGSGGCRFHRWGKRTDRSPPDPVIRGQKRIGFLHHAMPRFLSFEPDAEPVNFALRTAKIGGNKKDCLPAVIGLSGRSFTDFSR